MTDQLTRHDASLQIDGYCCAMMANASKAIDAAFAIGARDELNAVVDAIRILHKAAELAHDATLS